MLLLMLLMIFLMMLMILSFFDDILNDVVDIDVDADVSVDIDRYIFVMLFLVNAVSCINRIFGNIYTKIKLVSILSPFSFSLIIIWRFAST